MIERVGKQGGNYLMCLYSVVALDMLSNTMRPEVVCVWFYSLVATWSGVGCLPPFLLDYRHDKHTLLNHTLPYSVHHSPFTIFLCVSLPLDPQSSHFLWYLLFLPLTIWLCSLSMPLPTSPDGDLWLLADLGPLVSFITKPRHGYLLKNKGFSWWEKF